MIPFEKFKKESLQDPKVRAEYDKLEPEFRLITALIEKRLERGLTQAALARKLGTKQSAVARLESGSYNPSLSFLKRVAKALGTDIVIGLA